MRRLNRLMSSNFSARVGFKLILMIIQCMICMGGDGVHVKEVPLCTDIYVFNVLGSLATSARERKRATCGWEFRIKRRLHVPKT